MKRTALQSQSEQIEAKVLKRLSDKVVMANGTYRTTYKGFQIEIIDLTQDEDRNYKCTVSGKGLRSQFESEDSTFEVISTARDIVDGWYDDGVVDMK